MDLKANPDRTAEGVVIEAKLDKGRGAGRHRPGQARHAEARRHRRGRRQPGAGCAPCSTSATSSSTEAGPSVPVEILGLDGTPDPGEPFAVVENEARARELTEYRDRVKREKATGGVGQARRWPT